MRTFRFDEKAESKLQIDIVHALRHDWVSRLSTQLREHGVYAPQLLLSEYRYTELIEEKEDPTIANHAAALGDWSGIPDLTIFLPGGVTLLLEIKTPSGYLTDKQSSVIRDLSQMGHRVRVVRSVDNAKRELEQAVDGIIRRMA